MFVKSKCCLRLLRKFVFKIAAYLLIKFCKHVTDSISNLGLPLFDSPELFQRVLNNPGFL